MSQLNTRVVRRSNALLGWRYGRQMRYREVMGFGEGMLAPVLAGGAAAGLGAMYAAMQFKPAEGLLSRVLPAPGEGPSERSREHGYFRIETHTRTSTGRRYVCRIAAEGIPGYKATSVMFGQSALALALDGERLPAGGGVLTPATAMGDVLAERLRAAGTHLRGGGARRAEPRRGGADAVVAGYFPRCGLFRAGGAAFLRGAGFFAAAGCGLRRGCFARRPPSRGAGASERRRPPSRDRPAGAARRRCARSARTGAS